MFGFETNLCSATLTVEQPVRRKTIAMTVSPILIRYRGVHGAGFCFMGCPTATSRVSPLRIGTVKTWQRVKYSRKQREPFDWKVFRPRWE